MRHIILAIAITLAAITAQAASVPSDVIEQIKAEAAQDHPGDYSTQLYVVNKQKAAYVDLAGSKFRGCEPVLDEIMQKAASDHPGDYSTQLYVVKKSCAAYQQLR